MSGYGDFNTIGSFSPQISINQPIDSGQDIQWSIDETIEELKAAVVELESEDGLQRFVAGHGVQSLVFAFEWSSERLSIMFRMPYARVLSSEESQAEDNARIGVALRIAIALLVADKNGRLLSDGEAKLSVEANDTDMRYAVYDEQGEIIDIGGDWEPIVARVRTAFTENSEGLRIIWP